jgi:hypothetical protein
MTHPKKFLKIFEKTQAKKKPQLLAGVEWSSHSKEKAKEQQVAPVPDVSIYFVHRDSNPQLRP